MPDKTQAEISYSHIEYAATFKKPLIKAWSPPGDLITAILNRLEPWGFNLDGVEAKTGVEKLNESSIVFRRTIPPTPGQHVALGIGNVAVTYENADWSEVDQLIEKTRAVLSAVCEIGQAEVASQKLFLGI